MQWLTYMNAVLYADVDRDKFAELGRRWLSETLDEVMPGLAADLRARPVVRAKPLGNADVAVPWGEPGHVLGSVWTSRRSPFDGRHVLYSQPSWERTLTALGDHPFEVSLSIRRLDGRGFPIHRDREEALLRVWRDPVNPGLGGFDFGVSAEETRWPHTPALQDTWARFVKRQAATIGACFGSMTDDSGGLSTALETATASSGGPPNLDGPREVLRGYSWVSVIAAELAERLGGAAALAGQPRWRQPGRSAKWSSFLAAAYGSGRHPRLTSSPVKLSGGCSRR